MWTQIAGGVYLTAIPEMSSEHVNSNCREVYLGMSSENLNSFWVSLLLCRGLFYERPISSDLEESSGEVDFPHYPPNQPADLPAEEPAEQN